MTSYTYCDFNKPVDLINEFSVDVEQVEFEDTTLNHISPTHAVKITNNSSAITVIKEVNVDGNFKETNNIPWMLHSGDSCYVWLKFNPKEAGENVGTLTIKSYTQIVTVPLSGKGVAEVTASSGSDDGDSDNPTTVEGLEYWKESNIESGRTTAVLTPDTTLTSKNVAIAPVGDGSYQLSTVGNQRGVNAVDLQINSTSLTAVASGKWSVISGGKLNQSSAEGTVVGGGYGNMADKDYAGIASGDENTCTGTYSFIGGGKSNLIYGTLCSVGGGSNNSIGSSTNVPKYSFIGSGSNCSLLGDYSAIASGNSNEIISNSSFIGAGENNHIDSNVSFIGTGNGCTVSDIYDACITGIGNTISGQFSAIITGYRCAITDATYSLVGNSYGSQIIRSDYSVIGTGLSINITDSAYSFVGSINNGTISNSTNAYILAGSSNSIASASNYSGVLNGYKNTITASNYSFINSGTSNSISSSSYSAILNGQSNNISSEDSTDTDNVILSGNKNTITNSSKTSIIGTSNTIEDSFYIHVNGQSNTVESSHENNVLGTQHSFSGAYYSGSLGGFKNQISGYAGNALGGSRNLISGRQTIALGSVFGSDLGVHNHVFKALRDGVNWSPYEVNESTGEPDETLSSNTETDLKLWTNQNPVYQRGQILLQTIIDPTKGFYEGTSNYKKYLLTQSLNYVDDNRYYDLPNKGESNTFILPIECVCWWNMEVDLFDFTNDLGGKLFLKNGIIANGDNGLTIFKAHEIEAIGSENITSNLSNCDITLELDSTTNTIRFLLPSVFASYVGGATLTYTLATQGSTNFYWN